MTSISVEIASTPKLVEMTLEPRACESCGEKSDFEMVGSSECIVPKVSANYLFRAYTVLCKKCGFAFSSPCPKEEELLKYYADSYEAYSGIGLAYSIEPRLKLLHRYAKPQGVFAEVGGDRHDAFHSELRKLFKQTWNVEVSENASADFKGIGSLPVTSVDVIAHYDVLEHIRGVKDFLKSCHRALTKNGVMVCEVPDVRLYPKNLLLYEVEHLNHFSSATLASLAASCGFELLEIDHQASRPFGFAAVFRKWDTSQAAPVVSCYEFSDTLACLIGGLAQIEQVSGQIRNLQKRIKALDKTSKKVILWGVTELMRRLLKDFTLPGNVVVLDQDPSRRNHLQSHGVTVLEPKDQLTVLSAGELLAIFAPRYQSEITEWVRQKTGRIYTGAHLEVIGAGLL